MNKIFIVIEDIKQKITDNEYKIILDSLMEINKIPLVYENHKSNKFMILLQQLDTKIKITDDVNDKITRYELYESIIINFYNNNYYKNINFAKKSFKNILCIQQKSKIITMF